MGDKTEEWLQMVTKKFKENSKGSKTITLEAFKENFENKESPYIPRIFELFDKDGSGTISFGEMIDGFQLMINGSPEDKLKFLFDVTDISGDGRLDQDELDMMLSSSLADSNISITDADYDKLLEEFTAEVDEDQDGTISYEEMLQQFKKYPDLLPNMSLNVPGLISQSKSKPSRKSAIVNMINNASKFISWCRNRNNRNSFVLLIIYSVINLSLFSEATYKWRITNGANWYLAIARGNGACLNFNCAIIVVFVLRKFLTYLRSSRLHRYIQIDENIDAHRYVGYIIAIQALCHTIAHIGNADIVAKGSDGKITIVEVLLTNPQLTKLGHPWVAGTAFQTGWVLDIMLLIMVVCSMDFIRRHGHFQVFYVTHLLYVGFWGFLLLHGPRFWKFFLIPSLLFLYEKIMNMSLIRHAMYGGKSYIQEANLLSSNVTHLKITRPPYFDYEPGDYVFVKIPELSANEWHPFTISSAPEEKGTFSLHIRSAGNWTNQLYDFIRDKIDETEEPSDQRQARSMHLSSKRRTSVRGRRSLHAQHGNPIRSRKTSTPQGFDASVENLEGLIQVSIEGPYGTPTRAIFNAEHAVLIGAGIGVTPFASILQSIMHRYRLSSQMCPKCNHTWMEDVPETLMTLNKVNFIWINRDQKNFEWFIGLLAQMELEQDEEEFEKFFEMQMYMTKQLHENDMRGIALQMILQTIRSKSKKDILTGLKTHLQVGRPKWDKVFEDISNDRKGCVEIFFCGAPALGDVLEHYCDKYDFVFHKESF
ncbi:NADPH oxidase 5-like isoform X1 [Apostichopus japonicus]|uniref:NADPH oxidase 5-like isoform X1 n=1 Tax=Stichopus japonicus TaxID=307972 RepID=UPI003AB1E2ED